MIAFVVGASRGTGRLLVKQFLERGPHVKLMVGSPD
jgi:NAD(P)-dependent dehydrogenase (short-subunit alcohol dehydrogenase family)